MYRVFPMTTPNLIAATISLAAFTSMQSLSVHSLPHSPKGLSTVVSDNSDSRETPRHVKRRLLQEGSKNNTATTEAAQIDHRDNFELFGTIVGVLGGVTLISGFGGFLYGMVRWQKGRADKAREKEIERRKGEDELLRNIFGSGKTSFLDFSPSGAAVVIPMPPPLPETLTKQSSEVLRVEHFTGVFPNSAKKEEYTTPQTRQQAEAKWGGVRELFAHDNEFANRSDDNGNTPLHYCQNAEDVNVFIEWGADPNATNSDGNTPLHLCQSVDVLHTLLSHGANPNAINHNGSTPLHFCQSEDIAHALLSYGANPNLANNDGNTAIMVAAANSRTSVLIVLLDWLEVISFDERSALFHIAARSRNARLFRYLISRNIHRGLYFERRHHRSISTDQQSLLNPDGATLLHEA